jgi:hypothetical protein
LLHVLAKKAPSKSALKSSFAGPSVSKNRQSVSSTSPSISGTEYLHPVTDEDPTTPLAKRSRLNHELAESDGSKTPLKLKPPTSFAKLLHTTEKQSSAATPLSEKARGKKRMIPQDDDEDEEENQIQADGDLANEAQFKQDKGLSAIGSRLGEAAHRPSSPSKDTSSIPAENASSSKKPLQALNLGWTVPIVPKAEKHEGPGKEGKEDIKPSAWNRMIPFMEEKSEKQDILELLSPRKKRRGWVP